MAKVNTHQELLSRIEELEQQNQELRNEQLIYQTLFNNTLHEIHRWKLVRDPEGNIQTWRLQDANSIALLNWSKKREDVIGKTTDEIFPAANATTLFMPVVQQIFATGKAHLWEEYFAATDQTLMMNSVPIGDTFISTGFDISDLKRAQSKLEEANLRLTEAVKAGRVGIWDWNVREDKLVWDALMYEIYGVKNDAGKSTVRLWENALHPEDKDYALQSLNEALRGGKSYDIEFRIVRPNGQVRYIKGDAKVIKDAENRPIRMLGTNMDITARRAAEMAVVALEKRNQALLDHSPVCHKIVDLDFNLRYMNANGFRMLGLEINEERFGRPYPFSFFPDEAKVEMVKNLKAVVDSHKTVSFESLAKNAHGNDAWLFHTIIPVLKEDGKTLDYLTVVTADITEQKSVQEQLIHREKMDALGALAGGVAHDFNNQLVSILGYAELIERISSEPTTTNYARKIITGAERSSHLIKQMLAYSRKHQLQRENVDMHREIEEVIDFISHSIDKRICISTQLNASEHLVLADKSQIQSALLNLCLNACAAMKNGGNLQLITCNKTRDEDLILQNETDGQFEQFIKVSVIDEGHGISNQNLKRIFEPFFTTKSEGEGSGMGLASVYGTVKSHQGCIEVFSEEDHGATFNIYLPVGKTCNNNISDENYSTESNVSVSDNQHSILLVDDETSICDLCNELLTAIGYLVTVANNGKEAVEQYQKAAGAFDLVILDLSMPIMSGRDAYSEMRKINPDIKVIFFSGYDKGQSSDLLKFSQQHLRFIEKPFNLNKLLANVRELVI
ncbi:PAS domain-containing protein [Alteromonas flava]|uniref:hybrid sensor histidine kinase/response regulator n=1 Tax=Alteromonas flava TaxID=2048003 RepID=UPI000C28B0ED|nr:PAS domain-containing protein [Alteromonas flava]